MKQEKAKKHSKGKRKSVEGKKKRTGKTVQKKQFATSTIDHTTRTLEHIKRLEDIQTARSKEHRKADVVAFWTFLSMALLSNFFLSFIIVFLIVFLYDAMLFVLLAIIGLSFGILYSFFLHSLKTFSQHHVYAKVFMLLTGGINVVYIVTTTAIVMEFVELPFRKIDVVLFSLTYFAAYLLPYTIKLIFQRSKAL